MPLNAPTGSKNFEPAPAGTHPAALVQLIDLGTHENNYQGNITYPRKVRLVFELLGVKKKVEVDDGNGGKEEKEVNWLIGQEYTWSTGKKSNLRSLLDGMLGKLSDDDAQALDFTELVGKTCLLSIAHQTAKTSGNIYAVIDSAVPLPSAMVVDSPETETLVLAFEEGYWNKDEFEKLPQFLKEKIEASQEWEQWKDVANGEVPAPQPEISMDDIPF